ncbi:MAG: YihY family inner membrane protein [Nitrospirae bacterium]|nr:YihY family inner membrane protein [Nitrospirota bacterium]
MPTGFREKIADSFFILKESAKSFQKNNNPGTSASLAYYSFFAIIPLLLLVIYFLGNFVLSSQTALRGVEALASQMFPQFKTVVTNEILALSQHKNVWGILSIIALFWSITPLAGGLRNAFLKIFKSDKKIPFLKAKLFDSAAVLMILTLFTLLVLSQIFYSVIVNTIFKKLPFFLEVVNVAAPLITTMLFMSFFYLVFSPVKLKTGYILTGAAVTALLWSLMSPLFSIFLTYNPDYGVAFGSLKTIFILLVWVYYSFSVILFGIEVIANVRKKEALLLKGVFLEPQVSNKKHRRLLKKFGRSYNSGEIIFKEGDTGRDMFFVLSGAVSISKNEQTLKTMKEGDYFGEMSMLIQSPRTAAAVASEPNTQLLIISQDNFEIILREEPKVLLSVLKEMAQRLKSTMEYI